jgi:hypothetical protein
VKQPKTLLKIAVVASSVLLAGGFVCYRAGAYDWLMGTSSTATKELLPSSKVKQLLVVPVTPEQPASGTLQLPPAVMYSSKSGTIIPPATAQQPASGTTQLPPAVMTSSKSLILSPNHYTVTPPPAAKPSKPAR